MTLFNECHKAKFLLSYKRSIDTPNYFFFSFFFFSMHFTNKCNWKLFKGFNCKYPSLLALFLSPKQLTRFILDKSLRIWNIFWCFCFLSCTLEKFFGCYHDQQRWLDSGETKNNQPLCNSNFLPCALPETTEQTSMDKVRILLQLVKQLFL